MTSKKISPVEAEKVKAVLRDPVLWAKAFVVAMNPETKKYGPWIARDYQAEILRNRDIRKVYRMGRRLGKCLPGWVKILNPVTGEYVTIEELYHKKQNTSVVALNKQYQQSVISDCPIFDNGKQPVYRVQLSNGRYIDGTSNHPLFTVNGWTEIKDLRVNDYVAIPSKIDYFGNDILDINIVKLLAYMIGDGNCVNGNLRFSQQDNKQLKEFAQIVDNFNCELRQYKSNGTCDYHIVIKRRQGAWYTKSNVRKILEEYGVYGYTADNKKVPKIIFTLQKPLIATFISRLWATDGWATCNGKRTEIGYASNSKHLIYDLAHLLLRFGIRTYIRKKTDKSWTLGIYDKASTIIFANEIGIFGKEKALAKVLSALHLVRDYDTFMPPEVSKEIAAYVKDNKIKKRDIIVFLSEDPKNFRLHFQYKLQQWRAKLIADYLGLTDLAELCTGNIEWVQIKSISYIGEYQTYNLSVPELRNFIANDIYVHNTECMCIDGLWQCFTHRNYRVLYVTPYENQVNLIFMRLREIVNESPLIKAEVVKMKNSPYTVEFANGSVIMGFTMQVQDKQRLRYVVRRQIGFF